MIETTLRRLLLEAQSEFGLAVLIDCHSMPSTGSRKHGRKGEHGDFVIGDRDGTTCAPEFPDFVAMTLRGMGYEVHVNDGYKGVELVRPDPCAAAEQNDRKGRDGPDHELDASRIGPLGQVGRAFGSEARNQ